MDLRLGLWLLLLLAPASGARPKSSNPIRRQHRQALGPLQSLSEFLVPPPVPPGLRGPRPPHPPVAQRNGRYQRGSNEAHHNRAPGYLSQLMGWLNPFKPEQKDQLSKSSGQAPQWQPQQHQPVAQYAPRMPYTGGGSLYEPPPNPVNLQSGFSGLAAWMSGKPCNPCNQVPWVPIIGHGAHSSIAQYAPNAGGTYLSPPPHDEPKLPDFAHVTNNHQQNYPSANPPLYPGIVLPPYDAKPLTEPPGHQSPQNFNHQPPPSLNHHASFNNGPATSFHHQSNFDNHQGNFDSGPPSNLNHQPSYDTGPATSFHHQSNFDNHQGNFDSGAPSNLNHQPSYDNGPATSFHHQSNFDNHQGNFDSGPPSNLNHQSSFDSGPSSNFNHQSNFENGPHENLGHQSSSNFDHPASPNFGHTSFNFDQPPSNFDQGPTQNFNHGPPSNFNQPPSEEILDHPPPGWEDTGSDQDVPPGNFDEPHPPSNFEQHHQGSQIIGVVKEPPREPNHVESRPLLSNSPSSSPAPFPSLMPTRLYDPNTGATVHFQRSPLIDVSVAGEVSTVRPVYRPSTERPGPSLIDYIVSSSDSSSEEIGTSTVVPIARTTQPTVTTVVPMKVNEKDQRNQESRIETLVQSYEIYKKKNDTRTNDERLLPPRTYNDTDDSSASKELGLPSKDNGKKNKQVIQIIIPYTSQYTASPFHPTRSVNGKKSYDISDEPTTIAGLVDVNYEDNAVLEESRRVSVTRDAPELRNRSSERHGNAIDVHRLQKNIDNWTIQEYSRNAKTSTSSNLTYPRWLSSKQIPDEYLVTATELEDSGEYYDSSNETRSQHEDNSIEQSSPTRPPRPGTTSPTPGTSTSKVNIVNATYPKKSKKYEAPPKRNATKSAPADSEKVYVVTPVPNPNSLEELYEKDEQLKSKSGRAKAEQAYQVLPQAVNNLAVLSSPPDSAAPVLWGIMEHEELGPNVEQPRWRSEADVLPDPPATPILYAGHSKVSRAR